jgi:hypothetical protein
VVSCRERSDEPSGSCAMELVRCRSLKSVVQRIDGGRSIAMLSTVSHHCKQ